MFDIVRGHAWAAENPGRALRNSFMQKWDGREDALAGAVTKESEAYHAAVRAGDYETAVVWAGEAVDLTPIPSLAESLLRNLRDTKTLVTAATRATMTSVVTGV